MFSQLQAQHDPASAVLGAGRALGQRGVAADASPDHFIQHRQRGHPRTPELTEPEPRRAQPAADVQMAPACGDVGRSHQGPTGSQLQRPPGLTILTLPPPQHRSDIPGDPWDQHCTQCVSPCQGLHSPRQAGSSRSTPACHTVWEPHGRQKGTQRAEGVDFAEK